MFLNLFKHPVLLGPVFVNYVKNKNRVWNNVNGDHMQPSISQLIQLLMSGPHAELNLVIYHIIYLPPLHHCIFLTYNNVYGDMEHYQHHDIHNCGIAYRELVHM